MNKTFYLNSAFETKGYSKSKNALKISGYANTVDRDRAGDVIVASAWAKGVDNFRKNPVLLFQHDHNKPIGRIDKITVDKKGIYVEASVSDAAEKLHGVQSLIGDGVLKSFSVGFRVKDGKYERDTDSMLITDVELLEVSVVSVPCNQESLFSIKKSFDSEEEYSNFKKELMEKGSYNDKISIGVTAYVNDHYHTLEVDENGNGVTTYSSHGKKHYHNVMNHQVLESEDHSHEIVFMVKPSTMDEDDNDDEDMRPLSPSEMMSVNLLSNKKVEESTQVKAVEDSEVIEEKVEEEEELEATNPYEPIPFVNLLSAETSSITNSQFVKLNGKRWKVTKTATAQSPFFQFLEVDLNGETLDNTINVEAKNLSVVNDWDLDTKYDIVLTETQFSTLTDESREEIKKNFVNLVNMEEQDLYALKLESLTKSYQEKLNKTINLLVTPSNEWTDTNYQVAKHLVNQIHALKEINPSEEEDSNKNLALMLHGHNLKKNLKENSNMATQTTGDPIVVKTAAAPEAATEEVKKDTSNIEVSEPRVAELIEKTGEAILTEADAKEKKEYTPIESEQVAELKAQMKKYEEQIAALSNSKMVYTENSRSTQRFSEKEMANAYLLAKALNRRDPFDTKLGAKMKNVTTVDQFLSNFSTNIYEEMEQQLVVAPMFDRIQVDARTFRIPVSKEDTDGDVAQFESGTFATGIADATNVPTTNQNTIGSVDLTPHKFMATTHLAKDEEEDTVLPLMDFLRRAATRRLARAIDKAILRGDGSLSGFNASPTNTIAAGAGYAAVLKGIATLADDIAGLRTTTGGSSDKADASDIASARAKMGKYGLQLGDHLVYVTSVEGYNELVSFSDFRTVDKFGPNATYLTGAVGAIYGIPIVISEFMDNVGVTGNEIGVLVYKPGFIIAERRGMEIESEYEPRQQVTAMYMSTRFDFKALSSNANAALDATNFAYASLIECG